MDLECQHGRYQTFLEQVMGYYLIIRDFPKDCVVSSHRTGRRRERLHRRPRDRPRPLQVMNLLVSIPV